jgi:hypothetical protein
MVGFSEDPAWGKACTPASSNNAGSFSERSAWDNTCTPGGVTPKSCTRLTEDIDLATLTLSHGIKITGSGAEQSGWSVSGVGDIDNDGYDDFIIGAPINNANYGYAYLIYGSASPSEITLISLGTAGIEIVGDGASTGKAGFSVSGAGDVDGDGKADFIIGAPEFNSNYGKSYLIYGDTKANLGSTIELNTLGAKGVVINGDVVSFGKAGFSVSGAGDVDGDGKADFIIGAPEFNSNYGRSYLIYGDTKANLGSTIELNNLAAKGVVINGGTGWFGKAGYSVSGAGDVDGDGKADFIIGAPEFNSVDGISYLIYGDTKANLGSTIELNTLGAKGTEIIGPAPGAERVGDSVSGAGDINGDGKADFIIGAPQGASTGGISYLIYGDTKANLGSTIQLSTLAANEKGITITGSSPEQAGTSVSGAGDMDGDGYADFIIGAPGGAEGKSYLIYGSASPSDITLISLGSAGITITGVSTDQSGFSVSDAGDVNKNGCADLIIGAPAASDGESYIIYG